MPMKIIHKKMNNPPERSSLIELILFCNKGTASAGPKIPFPLRIVILNEAAWGPALAQRVWGKRSESLP